MILGGQSKPESVQDIGSLLNSNWSDTSPGVKTVQTAHTPIELLSWPNQSFLDLEVIYKLIEAL